AIIVWRSLRQLVGDPHVIAVAPSQFLECLQERRHAPALFRIVFSQVRKHTDPPHPLRLLCPRRKRPRRRSATEQRDELAPLHSITSSARASKLSGTMRPSALAVLRLT